MRARFLLLLLLLVAAPAAALDFVPCTEPGHEDFDCGTLDVPLDRTGSVPGVVTLAVERLRQGGPSLPVLIALAGGPGQSATSFGATFAAIARDVLDRYQLVVFDQRGTGRSGALECPPLLLAPTSEQITGCASDLGPAVGLYTTTDSVADLDAVREALGVGQVVLLGVSYGTHVALEYARTFPTRTAKLVLDSTVPPGGPGPFSAESLAASRRVIESLCAGGACAGFTRDPLADTTKVVRRLARRRRFAGPVVDGDGRRQRQVLDGAGLFGTLQAGDLFPLLQARYPGAVAAARRGDRAPLLRLAVLAGLGGARVRGALDPAVREFSPTLLLATACADLRFPWQETDGFDARVAALERTVDAVPDGVLLPFDHQTAFGSGLAPACLSWPTTSLARAANPAPPPDVPALILTGTRDVRTPIENVALVAQLLPLTVRVVAPGWGHSVLSGTECGRIALSDFLNDRPVGDPCAGLEPLFPAEAAPPRSVGGVRPIRGIPGLRGKVLRAILMTINDAIVSTGTVGVPGSTVQIGGLRRGRLTASVGAAEFSLALERYTLVSGVSLSGRVDASVSSATADVRVGGRMTGAIRIGADGGLSGNLGGQQIAGTLRSFTRTPLARVKTPALPPIP